MIGYTEIFLFYCYVTRERVSLIISSPIRMNPIELTTQTSLARFQFLFTTTSGDFAVPPFRDEYPVPTCVHDAWQREFEEELRGQDGETAGDGRIHVRIR